MAQNKLKKLLNKLTIQSQLIVKGLSDNQTSSLKLPQGNYDISLHETVYEVNLINSKLTENEIKQIESKPLNKNGCYDAACDSHIISIFDKSNKDLCFLDIEVIQEETTPYLVKNGIIFMLSDCSGGVVVFLHYLNDKLVGATITEDFENYERRF